MSLDALEGALATILATELPDAVLAENAAHSDGIAVPPVQTYTRGVPPTDFDLAPGALPLVSVACLGDQVLHDQPDDPGSLGDWGALVERLVAIVGMVLGTSAMEAHVRGLRLLEAIKQVGRAHVADQMNGTVMYWPYGAESEVHPAVLVPTGQHLTMFVLSYTRVRVVE